MMTPNQLLRRLIGGALLIMPLVLCPQAEAVNLAQISNPIARIARIFDPALRDVEDRIAWLAHQASSCPQHSEHTLKFALGYRGCRSHPGAADPSITLDLGSEMPIETLVLVPAQREFLTDPGIFPKRFTLDISNQADFKQRTIIFTSDTSPQQVQSGFPEIFPVNNSARYVRLTVQEGQNKGKLDLFGLSEFVVLSKGEPVSFGAAVTTVGASDAPGIWYPGALTDGRTPVGIWHNGSKPKLNPGDAVTVSSPDQTTTWTIQLDNPAPLDRIVLFPYQTVDALESFFFPESLTIRLKSANGASPETVFEWTNPLPGTSDPTPLVIPLRAKPAISIQLTATRPAIMGNQKIHALSEIEIWSHGNDLAYDRPVMREHDGQSSTVTSLTDGYSSTKKIIPVAIWFHQLHEREHIERELTPLRAVQRELATNSELNATWSLSMILGLAFMIPVFIVERRRLMTKDQLDQIRKRISSDLHDDIGSNLGSISLIAHTAGKDLIRLHGPKEIASDLTEMETIARESSLAMRDIVWMLERQRDSIGDLLQRMRETATRLLREIHFTLECESNKTATKLSLDAKRHLFLFYKEAIHNILKHSHATHVSIRMWDENDQLAIEILDNGIGIPVTAQGLPTAVKKLEDRAHLLNGQLQITSSKETGTLVRLMIKCSNLTKHTTS